MIESRQVDLVTAGYSDGYDNDELKHNWETWPDLNDDQPISHDAKLVVLTQLSPANPDPYVAHVRLSQGCGAVSVDPHPAGRVLGLHHQKLGG